MMAPVMIMSVMIVPGMVVPGMVAVMIAGMGPAITMVMALVVRVPLPAPAVLFVALFVALFVVVMPVSGFLGMYRSHVARSCSAEHRWVAASWHPSRDHQARFAAVTGKGWPSPAKLGNSPSSDATIKGRCP
ncbi:hypothetical protein ATO4_24621 [Aurantimonas sp. 22II-16-19i]|nr:hypothetical protein ATO4_24621 [Aurantimonas sp. 22II-16-19i]